MFVCHTEQDKTRGNLILYEHIISTKRFIASGPWPMQIVLVPCIIFRGKSNNPD